MTRSARTRRGPARPRTVVEDRKFAEKCLAILGDYRAAVAGRGATDRLRERAREALVHLGGDPTRATASLKDYDHARYGPFLGVSDEGSAAGAIREAALASPKARALPQADRQPLPVGVAVDAERLGAVGEVAVGLDEYADIWLECVDRVLVTTNVGTRVNVRVYRREPVVVLKSDSATAIETAKREIAAAFKPFVDTPDLLPRPLTVFVDIPRYVRMSRPRKRAVLGKLVVFVSSGRAAAKDLEEAPPGQELGLAVWVKLGPRGRDEAIAAIELAAAAGISIVSVEGVKRRAADRAVSLAGLLDYFPPGLVGPILRAAGRKGIRIRTVNVSDTDTIARSVWVGLTTARSYGANLGKYGCFPMTLEDTDHIVQQIQQWLPEWSAAPVFFLDQGVLRSGGVDVGRDLTRGLQGWLTMVASHGVRVVLIDTIDKASGKRLLRKSFRDDTGFLGPKQLARVEAFARRLGVKVLWAGGLGLRDAFEMGRLGVFGIYVTSAAATTIPVPGSYARDPSLAGVKEPSTEAVLRTKILLEAGFLSVRLNGGAAAEIAKLADGLLTAHDGKNADAVAQHTRTLASACEAGWCAYWKAIGPAAA